MNNKKETKKLSDGTNGYFHIVNKANVVVVL
jgi:hypothetical protein